MEYLTREIAEVFSPLNRFLLQSLVPISFLVLLKYSFLPFSCSFKILLSYFFHVLLKYFLLFLSSPFAWYYLLWIFLTGHAIKIKQSIIPSICSFFFQEFLCFPDWAVSFLQLFHFSLFSSSYLPTPPLGQDMTQGQFLNQV